MSGIKQTARRASLAQWTIFALGVAVCATTQLQVLGNDLIWDDEFLILGAEHFGNTDQLWSTLSRPFWQNSNYLSDLLHDYWRPVTTLAIWLAGLLGADWAPGFHALSLLAGIGAALSFYGIAGRIVGSANRWVARWLALIFLIHPLAAEVSCLVANSADHFCFSFLALSVLLFLSELDSGGGRWKLPLAGLLALLACGSKELGVVVAAAPITAWLLRKTVDPTIPARLLLRPQIWSAALLPVATYLVLRHLVTTKAGHVETQLPDIAFYVWTAFLGVGQALRQIVVPIPSGAYAYLKEDHVLPIAIAAFSWLAIFGTAFWTAYRTRAWKLPLVGLLVALALLLPSLLSADRFGYALRFPTRYFHLPLAGALIAFLPFAIRVWDRGLRLAVPLIVGLLALLSWIRIDEWHDSVRFFRAEATYHPESAPDRLNLVRALTNAGAFDAAEKVIESIDELPGARDKAIQTKLLNDRAAIALLRDRDVEGASKLLELALTISPGELENVLDLSSMRVAAGRPDQAVIILEKALDSPWFRDYRRSSIERRLARYRERATARSQTPSVEPGQ